MVAPWQNTTIKVHKCSLLFPSLAEIWSSVEISLILRSHGASKNGNRSESPTRWLPSLSRQKHYLRVKRGDCERWKEACQMHQRYSRSRIVMSWGVMPFHARRLWSKLSACDCSRVRVDSGIQSINRNRGIRSVHCDIPNTTTRRPKSHAKSQDYCLQQRRGPRMTCAESRFKPHRKCMDVH